MPMKMHPWLIATTFLYAGTVIGVGGYRLLGALADWCYCCTIMGCISCCYAML
jgi:hypothetical protein